MSNIVYIPDEVKKTLLFMDYVGGITEDKKLFFKELEYVGSTDYYLRYKRYMEEENLESQLEFMKKLFNTYIKLKSGYDEVFLIQLNNSFKRFCRGICILCTTYKDKPKLNNFCDFINDYREKKI